MRDNKPDHEAGLPDDEHLREDVGAAPAEGPEAEHLTLGQTNAGQQVAGLASGTGYGEDAKPVSPGDGNHPV